jgi:hypothetical protein
MRRIQTPALKTYELSPISGCRLGRTDDLDLEVVPRFRGGLPRVLIVAQISTWHNHELAKKRPAERRAKVKGCHDAEISGAKNRGAQTD